MLFGQSYMRITFLFVHGVYFLTWSWRIHSYLFIGEYDLICLWIICFYLSMQNIFLFVHDEYVLFTPWWLRSHLSVENPFLSVLQAFLMMESIMCCHTELPAREHYAAVLGRHKENCSMHKVTMFWNYLFQVFPSTIDNIESILEQPAPVRNSLENSRTKIRTFAMFRRTRTRCCSAFLWLGVAGFSPYWEHEICSFSA